MAPGVFYVFLTAVHSSVLGALITVSREFVTKNKVEVTSDVVLRDRHRAASLLAEVASQLQSGLAKDPDARWHSAHDLHDELAWIAADGTSTARIAATTARPWRERAGWIAALAVAALAALGVLGSGWRSRSTATDVQEMRLQIVTPPSASPGGFAISPDRRALVYQASIDGRPQLWMCSLDSDTARPLEGTEGASMPFWAPDARSIGFFAGGQLKRIDLAGGLVRVLATVSQPRGGTWGAQGTILFAGGSAGFLTAVPASSGNTAVATRVDRPRQTGHRFPHFLPDGRQFLFYCLGSAEGRGVYMGTLGSTDVQRLFDADSAAVFAAPDRVLFGREGALWAQRVDLTAMRPVGEPVTVSTQLAVSADLFGDVALSETAPELIAYRAGAGKRQFRWFDRTGRQVGATGGPDEGQPSAPQLSPDSRTVMFRRTIKGNTDLWSIEAPGTFSASSPQMRPVSTSPCGHHAVTGWCSARIEKACSTSTRLLFPVAAHRPKRCCSKPPSTRIRTDWSADGRFILYSVQSQATGFDLWVLPLFGDRTPTPVVRQLPMSFAAASRQTVDGWRTNPTSAAGAKCTCNPSQARLDRRRFRQAVAWRRLGEVTDANCSFARRTIS